MNPISLQLLRSSSAVVLGLLTGVTLFAAGSSQAQTRSQTQRFRQTIDFANFGQPQDSYYYPFTGFTAKPFNPQTGILESVKLSWEESGSFKGRTGNSGGFVQLTTGRGGFINGRPYGSISHGEGNGTGPASQLNARLDTQTFKREFTKDQSHDSAYWSLFTGPDNLQLTQAVSPMIAWAGLAQGQSQHSISASLTYTYLDVLPTIRKSTQTLKSPLRFTDFLEQDRLSTIPLGAINFTVQPFDHKLGKLRAVEIDWQSNATMEGITGLSGETGVIVLLTGGNVQIGSDSYNGFGSGKSTTADANSPIRISLSSNKITNLFEEDEASQFQPRIWDLMSGSTPYTISYSNPSDPTGTLKLQYRNISSGIAEFPISATISYSYLPYREATVPGPLPWLAAGSAWQFSRRCRSRVIQRRQ